MPQFTGTRVTVRIARLESGSGRGTPHNLTRACSLLVRTRGAPQVGRTTGRTAAEIRWCGFESRQVHVVQVTTVEETTPRTDRDGQAQTIVTESVLSREAAQTRAGPPRGERLRKRRTRGMRPASNLISPFGGMADALVLGTSVFGRESSNLSGGTGRTECRK